MTQPSDDIMKAAREAAQAIRDDIPGGFTHKHFQRAASIIASAMATVVEERDDKIRRMSADWSTAVSERDEALAELARLRKVERLAEAAATEWAANTLDDSIADNPHEDMLAMVVHLMPDQETRHDG